MNILHYALGFPPYRTGGLTRYVMDLMKEEVKQGHNVSLLWPGKMNFTKNSKVKVKKDSDYAKICSYEIVNPLPVPLLNGINDYKSYTKKCDKKVYYEFLKNNKFDCIHVHTLMGIHKEFFEVAQELNIRMVYTTHDYFGICPKVSLFYNNMICNSDDDCSKCVSCNKSALSIKKIKILQSPVYRYLKDSKLVQYLRGSYKKSNDINVGIDDGNLQNKCSQKDYKNLRKYYFSIFSIIDVFHFNSSNAKKVFEEYINIKNGKVINILHDGIKDNRHKKEFNHKTLKMSYLGSANSYKGYNLLKKVLDELYINGYRDFELEIFTSANNVSEYMKVNECFKFSELGKVMENTDLLLVPSVWNETFGFVALEGISYGVPVLLTSNVGCKDIFKNNKTGFIVQADYKELKNKILEIIENRKILSEVNEDIINDKDYMFNFSYHVKEIIELY